MHLTGDDTFRFWACSAFRALGIGITCLTRQGLTQQPYRKWTASELLATRRATGRRSFEGGIAACAAPLVGFIAERAFGFQVGSAGGSSMQHRWSIVLRHSWFLGSLFLGSLLPLSLWLPHCFAGIFAANLAQLAIAFGSG